MGEASTENTKAVLTEFLQRVLGIEDAQSIEYQRVHQMGKPRKENGRERIIIACFLRFSDRERVFKCGRKLKDTEYKMYEDLPKEIHEKRKLQMEKLKSAGRMVNVLILVDRSLTNFTLTVNTSKCKM